MNGELEIWTLDSYQPSEGDLDVFRIVEADEQALGDFDAIFLNGNPLESEFLVGADRRAVRDHVGHGQFVTLRYPDGGVELSNYTALGGDDTNGERSSDVFEDFLDRRHSTSGCLEVGSMEISTATRS